MKYVLWVILSLTAVLLSYVLLLFVSTLFVSSKKIYMKDSKYFRWLLYSSTGIALFFGRIHTHIKGIEKIPTDSRFFLVCNHKSKFDPITTWYMLRKYDLAFVSKDANFHVPIWGRIIRKCCFLSIDRENTRKALETINIAADLIKKDEVSVALYPEGTRNRGNEVLLPFRKGAFKVAQKAQVPIVICGIRGTAEIKHNFPLHRSDVYLEVLDVLSAETVKEMHTNEISDYARKLMLEYIENNK